MVERIVSGGQTGVDRAALDVALELGIEIGGWLPRGRRAEDGRVPDRYRGLVETDSEAYACRTEWNVRDSDATVILVLGVLSGGSKLTAEFASSLGKPLLTLDLERCTEDEAGARLRDWLSEKQTRVLNVAGPRASGAPEIGAAAVRVLRAALAGDPA